MGSQQIQKLETDLHIKASSKQFYEILSSKINHISNMIPEKVQGTDILEGESGTEGSIVFWNYVHDGKACVAKELVEFIDIKNNKITFKVLEGDVLEHYKSFRVKVHVIPQKEGSVVHLTLEYEKLKSYFPEPHAFLNLAIDLSKDIDTCLTSVY